MHHGVKQLSTLAVFSFAASTPSDIFTKCFVTVSSKEKKNMNGGRRTRISQFFFQGKTQNSQLVDSARSAINYARPFIQILNLKHFCNATGRFMEALQPGSVFVHNRVAKFLPPAHQLAAASSLAPPAPILCHSAKTRDYLCLAAFVATTRRKSWTSR